LYVEVAAIGLAVLAVVATGIAIQPPYDLVYDPAPSLAFESAFESGLWVAIVLTAAILWLLLTLFMCDFLWFRLPDILNAALILAALAWVAAIQFGVSPKPNHMLLPASVAQALIGALWGAGSFWAIRIVYFMIRRRHGLGLGDVKLMAALGALVGPWLLPYVVLMAAMLAILISVVWAHKNGEPLNASQILPFGSFLTASAGIIWLGGLIV
jgi:leader peptidase (prepilin peptidase)/N-methyltransferase